MLAYESLIDRAMLLFCEQLEARFILGPTADAGKAFDIADWISFCKWKALGGIQSRMKLTVDLFEVSWDLLGQITWSGEMGFMKTGSDIKNMIHIGELSMMYLGLVRFLLGLLHSDFLFPRSTLIRAHVMS